MRCFWPLWVICASLVALRATGWASGAWSAEWADALPHDALAWLVPWGIRAALAGAVIGALWFGLRRFRWPTGSEAAARVDSTLPGRPLASLADAQAIGAEDPASRALWQAHQDRMKHRAAQARPVRPNLRLASRDQFGLRYIALLFLSVALLFGSVLQGGSSAPIGPGAALTVGPSWEGWIQPPDYTGAPTLYLNDLPSGALDLPEGSKVILRFYGASGESFVTQTVATAMPAADEIGGLSFAAQRSGLLALSGPAGRSWQITVIPDTPPLVDITGPVEASAKGEMRLPFLAQDDYGIRSGAARITLDLPRVARQHGRQIAPADHPDLVLDLPLPFTANRDDIEETLVDDFSKHPFANLPVRISLSVQDAAGNQGQTDPLEAILPGRRFFQPTAAAIAEQRQDLLWSPENAPRVAQILRALAWQGEDHLGDPAHLALLRDLITDLETRISTDATAPADLEDYADRLWEFALELEEGALADALARLERAEARLAEAMRNGASDAEIAELMEELRAATDDYLQMLADQTDPEPGNGTDQPDQNEDDRTVRQDEIQRLMDEIERLMQEGRMEEARQLMQQLSELMRNLEIRQGEGGEGGPQLRGQQSLDDMGQSLRDQQELSDDAFRQLQEQSGSQGDGPSSPAPNQSGPDQPAPGEGPPQAGDLAERQRALRDEIDRQRQALPGLPSEQAETAERALDRAGEAMDDAEEALGAGNLPDAIDNQSRAMEALREGLRAWREALDEEGRARQGEIPGQQGTLRPERNDPLDRESGGGEGGRALQSDGMTLDEDAPQKRGQALVDELRRRQQELGRPELERDYIDRLLRQF